MREPFECGHPDEHVTLRRRVTGSSTLMFGHQCSNCGRLVGTWVKKERIKNPQELPEWDVGIEKEWVEREQIYAKKYRDQKVKNLGVAGFAKDESRSDEFWKKYNEYLSSEPWHRKREIVLQRAKGLCEGCGTAKATQVHHLTYTRVGKEMLFDLVAICEHCHDTIHGKAA